MGKVITGGNELVDIGFNKTYLPAVFNSRLYFNSDRFLWSAKYDGSDLKRINKGFRVSVANSGEFLAYYGEGGIFIADTSMNVVKRLEVDYNPDVQITWTFDDSGLSFSRGNETFVYLIQKDSIYKIGNNILQPVWLRSSPYFLYTRLIDGGKLEVCRGTGLNEAVTDRVLGEGFAPHWSQQGALVAYFRERIIDNYTDFQSDLLPARLLITSISNPEFEVIFDDAGFTDGVYPQIVFCSNDSTIYYTGLSKHGTGIIREGKLFTGESKTIFEDVALDLRFPVAIVHGENKLINK